jgi:hypothetical protein
VNDAEAMGRQAEQSDALDYAIRIGFVAYGVVHLVIGWLAIQLALGQTQRKASTTGAMRELAEGPLGKSLVWAVAIGMLLLVVWRVLEAAVGHREVQDDGKRLRKRAVSGLKAVLYGAIGWTAFKVAIGAGGSGSSRGGNGLTAKLMSMPGGPVLVVLTGLAIIGYAGNLAWHGWKEKFAEHLDTEGKMGRKGSAFLVAGQVGYIAKGVALAIVGGLFVFAGINHDSEESGGLDVALQKVLQQPFGPVLLFVIGLGIICYGLFCFVRARYLDE